jgi:hypothetical protein
VTCSCEHSDKPLGFLKNREFFYQLSDYHLSRMVLLHVVSYMQYKGNLIRNVYTVEFNFATAFWRT